MLYNFNFYSSVLLITFSQGIIFSVLLLKKGFETDNKSNFWLSLFVFLCSLYIAPWMLGFAGWYDNQPYRDFMFYTPFQHLFFIGPIIYFYTQSLLNPSFTFKKKHFIHLIPGVIYLIYSLIVFVYDKIIVKDYYFYANGIDKDFDSWHQILGQISMIFYFVITLKYYNLYKKMIFQIASNADEIRFKWIRNYLTAFLIMIILPPLFDIFSFIFPEIKTYIGGWWFYLMFSLILYYIAITGYSNQIETKFGFKISDQKGTILLLDQNSLVQNATTIDINHEVFENETSTDITHWKQKIEQLILSEKLYQNPELSLTEISKKLKSNASVISKAVNQGFGMNFNDFINNYRIEAVKTMFANGEHKKSTLLGIAFDCGFNSKATFNRAFKKNTNLSPKDYINTI